MTAPARRRTPGTRIVCTCAAAALLAGRPAAAQPGSGGEAVHLTAEVVVDTAAGVAYVTSEGGGIEAVDLATGSRRWRTQAADRPLLLTGALLVAQAEPRTSPGDLRLVTLDTRRNGAAVTAGRSELPAGVAASNEAPTAEFEAKARLVDDDVVVNWEYTTVVRQGRRPEPGREPDGAAGAEPGVIRRAGAVRMDLSSGATARLLGAEAEPAPPRAVRLDANRLAVPEPGEQFLSSDSQHVLVSEPIADDPAWDKYRWTIYERATLRRVGETRSHVSFSPFIVRDDQIIHQVEASLRQGSAPEPKQLRAVSLDSGVETWSVAVRDDRAGVTLPP